MILVVGHEHINQELVVLEELDHLFVGMVDQLNGVLYRFYFGKYNQRCSVVDTDRYREAVKTESKRIERNLCYDHILLALEYEKKKIKKGEFKYSPFLLFLFRIFSLEV
jgi:hypothetical protein